MAERAAAACCAALIGPPHLRDAPVTRPCRRVGGRRYGPRHSPDLDALIAEATVDCYGDDEQLTGLLTMVDENVAVPFDTVVLGVPVTVRAVELTVDGRIAALVREGLEQRISLLDLPLPDPRPDGVEWVQAYRRWTGRWVDE